MSVGVDVSVDTRNGLDELLVQDQLENRVDVFNSWLSLP